MIPKTIFFWRGGIFILRIRNYVLDVNFLIIVLSSKPHV